MGQTIEDVFGGLMGKEPDLDKKRTDPMASGCGIPGRHEKLGLNDTPMSAMIKMADGNPGAVGALGDIMLKAPMIDPDSAFGNLGPLLSLDTYGIYGTEIYILWSDQCNRDTRELLMLLRACQLGIVSEAKLKAVAEDQTRQIKFTQEEMDDFNSQVMEKLDNFMPRAVQEND